MIPRGIEMHNIKCTYDIMLASITLYSELIYMSANEWEFCLIVEQIVGRKNPLLESDKIHPHLKVH